MNEAETRAEHIDPALKEASWGVVDTAFDVFLRVDAATRRNVRIPSSVKNAEGWGTPGRLRLLHYDGPGGIGIEGGHGGCRFCRGFAQILLDQYAVLVDHEGHHA